MFGTLARRTRRTWERWRQRRATAKLSQASIGAGCTIDPSVQVLGWRQVRIGDNVIIGEDCWLNVNDRTAESPGIVIGNHSFIGRRNFFTSGRRLQIGAYCLTGLDCHFLGSDHVHASPFAPYVSTGSTCDGIIEVGPNCWFGASVIVLKNVRIGCGSIIGAGAVVTRDIPPFSIAAGTPARVLKRFDVALNEWVPIESWSAEAEARLPAEADYLAELVKTHPHPKLPRIASSSLHGGL
jgi:acetyltransferase-like isoleucine patch superfamily enzyme